jgi:hypothetical protein
LLRKAETQSDSSIRLSLAKAARQIVSERKNEDVLSNDDLDLIWRLMDDNSEKNMNGIGCVLCIQRISGLIA